jgi:hypothetical protein
MKREKNYWRVGCEKPGNGWEKVIVATDGQDAIQKGNCLPEAEHARVNFMHPIPDDWEERDKALDRLAADRTKMLNDLHEEYEEKKKQIESMWESAIEIYKY